jgi:broad specificity phosphatase PhoE
VTLESLILLRHGQTDWNVQLRMQGHTDIALNAVGRAQAAAAAPSVAALRPEVIISSDLSRARETAGQVAQVTGLPVGVDKRLRETNLGKWESLTRTELESGWPQLWQQWRSTAAHTRPPGGESRWEVAQRGGEVVSELDAGSHRTALLVAHGGLIVGLTGFLLELPDTMWNRLIGLNNCHWVVLHRRLGRWSLHSYNAGLGGVVIPGNEDEVPGA